MADLVDLLRRSTGRGLQNIQYAMPEALRNYVGKAEWDEKKNAQDFYGGDFEAQERADKMMGFGTDAAGLVGAIKAVRPSSQSDLAQKLRAMGKTSSSKGLSEYEMNHLLAYERGMLPKKEGGLGLGPEHTAMDRADILFPDDAFHGTGEENIRAFNIEGKGKTSGAGAFTSDNPIQSETYVPGLGQSGNILPLRVNRKGLMEVNAKGNNWNDINTNDLFHKRKALVDMFPDDLSWNDGTTTDEIAQLAPYGGFEGVTIKNVKDSGPNSHVFRVKEFLKGKYGIEPSESHEYWDQVSSKQLAEARKNVEKMYASQKGNVTSFQNPSRIRSRFAAFDPFRKDEADLLAGGVAGTEAAMEMSDEDKQKFSKALFDALRGGK